MGPSQDRVGRDVRANLEDERLADCTCRDELHAPKRKMGNGIPITTPLSDKSILGRRSWQKPQPGGESEVDGVGVRRRTKADCAAPH